MKGVLEMLKSRASRRVLISAALLALPLALASCPEPEQIVGGCGRSGFYCPEGFACNESTGECECDGTLDACGEGSVCDTATGRCVCSLDECCPDGYAFNAASMACVCANDECCPPDYQYDDEARMCVCALDICCPPGFDIDAEGRCLCTTDESCGDGFTCDQASGDCRCLADTSCQSGAFCNDFGFCQERAACTSSFDCPDRMVCDKAQGFCLTGYCAIDADCPFGRICHNGACVRGCNSSDDCWLAQACIEGHCRGAFCDRDAQCGFGEYCGPTGSCVRAAGAFCASCSQSLPCPEGSTCVSWMVEGDPETFCAVDCDEDNPCPNGYSCGGTYSQCDPSLEWMLAICSPYGLDCIEVEIHNEPDITHMCGTGTQPKPLQYTCGPIFGSCDGQPAVGETTRPGPGAACTTLCRDGLVCANLGMGYRCYAACPTGTCSGSFQCKPAENGIDMICAPP